MEEAYKAIGVSRATLFNWFQRDKAPPGKAKVDKLRRYLDADADWVLYGRAPANRLKSGDSIPPLREPPGDRYGQVALRLNPKREPSTRADCEMLFQEILDGAEASGNPNAFPVIHDALCEYEPLTKWLRKQKPHDP